MKISIEKKKQILKHIDAHPNQKLRTIQRTHAAFKHLNYKARWKQQIACGGSEDEILEAIEKYTLDQFREARSLCKGVHDVDLKKWALQKSLDFKYVRFKAGHQWINTFKRRNGLVNRKIQKLVSTREIQSDAAFKTKCVNQGFKNKIFAFVNMEFRPNWF